jgi:hypothetical protein
MASNKKAMGPSRHPWRPFPGREQGSGVTGFKIKIKVEEASKLIHHFTLNGHLNISLWVCQGQS